MEELGIKLPEIVINVLAVLGSIVVAGGAYILATPNKDDDKWLQKMEKNAIIGPILRTLIRFSPLQRKEGGELGNVIKEKAEEKEMKGE